MINFSLCFVASDPSFITDVDTALLFLPFFHVYGQVITLLSGLSYGARTVIMDKFDMVDFLTFFARYKVESRFACVHLIINY